MISGAIMRGWPPLDSIKSGITGTTTSEVIFHLLPSWTRKIGFRDVFLWYRLRTPLDCRMAPPGPMHLSYLSGTTVPLFSFQEVAGQGLASKLSLFTAAASVIFTHVMWKSLENRTPVAPVSERAIVDRTCSIVKTQWLSSYICGECMKSCRFNIT